MEPLSCANCLHNPLQLGAVGTAFGYCTRHGLFLHESSQTTCGQLLRKDLNGSGLVSEPNGETLHDGVVEDVAQYGLLPTKAASLAALWTREGVRAEVATLSLGRAYFFNCTRHRGKWSAGIHLAHRTLKRLLEEPAVRAHDLREPVVAPMSKAIDLAMWGVVAQRVAILIEVGRRAERDKDDVARWAKLGMEAIASSAPGSTKSLLSQLRSRVRRFREVLDHQRYRELSMALHRS